MIQAREDFWKAFALTNAVFTLDWLIAWLGHDIEGCTVLFGAIAPVVEVIFIAVFIWQWPRHWQGVLVGLAVQWHVFVVLALLLALLTSNLC